jgi:hypothetical protein
MQDAIDFPYISCPGGVCFKFNHDLASLFVLAARATWINFPDFTQGVLAVWLHRGFNLYGHYSDAMPWFLKAVPAKSDM